MCFFESCVQGEVAGQTVERLVNGRLGVLSRGIVLTGESEEAGGSQRGKERQKKWTKMDHGQKIRRHGQEEMDKGKGKG